MARCSLFATEADDSILSWPVFFRLNFMRQFYKSIGTAVNLNPPDSERMIGAYLKKLESNKRMLVASAFMSMLFAQSLN